LGGIAGFCSGVNEYSAQRATYAYLLGKMSEKISHRGDGASEGFVDDFIGFFAANAKDVFINENFRVIADGEIYNRAEIVHLLESKGFAFRTKNLPEIILGGYLHYGAECASILNGEFAFVIWDSKRKIFFMCRDRLGLKPLFYAIKNRNIVFGSEIKALFEFPDISRNVGQEGLCAAFGLSPRPDGCGVFDEIKEVKSGHYAVYKNSKLIHLPYWSFTSVKNDFTREEAVEHARFIITDAMKRRLDKNACAIVKDTWSRVAASIAARELEERGEKLTVFTIDEHFEFSAQEQIDALLRAVIACDYPCGGSERSLSYDKIAPAHPSVITGDCAAEFGFWTKRSPFAIDYNFKKSFLSRDFIQHAKPDECAKRYLQETLRLTPRLPGENPKAREASYIGVKLKAARALELNDRLCAAVKKQNRGQRETFAARSPYTDCRVAEFFWNIPIEMKANGSLIKDAFKDYPPLLAPGSPAPEGASDFHKKAIPDYAKALRSAFLDILSPRLTPFINKEKLLSFISDAPNEASFENIRATRLMETFIQVENWLDKYNVRVTL
jgi:asparagine synthase (glutamine-hydrolysing)